MIIKKKIYKYALLLKNKIKTRYLHKKLQKGGIPEYIDKTNNKKNLFSLLWAKYFKSDMLFIYAVLCKKIKPNNAILVKT